MNTRRFLSACVIAAGIGVAACSETDPSGDAQAPPRPLFGNDTFLYFRSNASGWGVDDATRLATSLGGTFRIDVNQEWMIRGSDVATVTETNEFNGWGNRQTFYVVSGTEELVVPGGLALVAAPKSEGARQFRVKYAELGRHQVIVDMNGTPTISIQSEASACRDVSCPIDSRCKLAANGFPACGGE